MSQLWGWRAKRNQSRHSILARPFLRRISILLLMAGSLHRRNSHRLQNAAGPLCHWRAFQPVREQESAFVDTTINATRNGFRLSRCPLSQGSPRLDGWIGGGDQGLSRSSVQFCSAHQTRRSWGWGLRSSCSTRNTCNRSTTKWAGSAVPSSRASAQWASA